ncbi:hypothetical protein EYS14_03580 [Alteromonadaceae bacterium M269]|nr:hypothetical protein EYS14_03580 [Alteromonadaceae bacterium M269]
MDNLKLWNAVEKTDMEFTKALTPVGAKNQLTAINPEYIFRKATEQFGICGIGWGYEILSEEIVTGPQIPGDHEPPVYQQAHNIHIKLWYVFNGDKGELVHYGHTPVVYATEWGVKFNKEYKKMSLTDALKKCLTLLGFGADVHMGLYDDDEYLEGRLVESELNKADNREEALSQKVEELNAWLSKQLTAYPYVPKLPALENMHKKLCEHLQMKSSALGIPKDEMLNQLEDAFESAKLKIEGK